MKSSIPVSSTAQGFDLISPAGAGGSEPAEGPAEELARGLKMLAPYPPMFDTSSRRVRRAATHGARWFQRTVRREKHRRDDPGRRWVSRLTRVRPPAPAPPIRSPLRRPARTLRHSSSAERLRLVPSSRQVDQKGHHDECGKPEQRSDTEGHVETVDQARGRSDAGLQLRMTSGGAQDGHQDGQSERSPHLLGDVDQARRRAGITGSDTREAGRGQRHERGPRAQAQRTRLTKILEIRRPGVQLARAGAGRRRSG